MTWQRLAGVMNDIGMFSYHKDRRMFTGLILTGLFYGYGIPTQL
jgi:hypothetical protein